MSWVSHCQQHCYCVRSLEMCPVLQGLQEEDFLEVLTRHRDGRSATVCRFLEERGFRACQCCGSPMHDQASACPVHRQSHKQRRAAAPATTGVAGGLQRGESEQRLPNPDRHAGPVGGNGACSAEPACTDPQAGWTARQEASRSYRQEDAYNDLDVAKVRPLADERADEMPPVWDAKKLSNGNARRIRERLVWCFMCGSADHR